MKKSIEMIFKELKMKLSVEKFIDHLKQAIDFKQ